MDASMVGAMAAGGASPVVVGAAFELPLRGAGGEPVHLRRTATSRGLASLPPLRFDPERRAIEATFAVGDAARTVRIGDGSWGSAVVEVLGPAPKLGEVATLRRSVAHMLRLEEDLSPFYAAAAADPELAWVAIGAGRMVRSPTVFEEVAKTICTTNCAWSGTVRMVGALVAHLGQVAPGGGRAFPTAAAMAAAPEEFYRDVARAGYRGRYLRSLAQEVASGRLDLEPLATATADELTDEEVARRLLAIPGVGPYAAAHAMLLLGRASRLILDSWTRPTYARLTGGLPVADAVIEARFARYGRYAGLAFWSFLTEPWVAEESTESG